MLFRLSPEMQASRDWTEEIHSIIEIAKSSLLFLGKDRLVNDLPVLCCEAVGGDERQARVITVAWRLLYTAAKMLDDVEDGDLTTWRGIGPSQAINAATSLIFAAQLALSRLCELGVSEKLTLTICEDFNSTSLRICLGQHADLTEENPSIERYFQIVASKSGEPFALACRAGAPLGTRNPERVAHYSEFGYNLGVIIQIMDDFEGIWNIRCRSDLVIGKRALPIIYAISVAPMSMRERIERLLVEATYDKDAE
jgi:competence protein ComQ